MTQRFFLTSRSFLPIGEFGRKFKTDHKNRMVFKNELDFAGLWIVKVKKADISNHLKQPYVVEIMAEGGHFGPGVDGLLRETDTKCLSILFDYIKEQFTNTSTMEFYSAWHGEENLKLSKKRIVAFEDLATPLQLVIGDREYIEFRNHFR